MVWENLLRASGTNEKKEKQNSTGIYERFVTNLFFNKVKLIKYIFYDNYIISLEIPVGYNFLKKKTNNTTGIYQQEKNTEVAISY